MHFAKEAFNDSDVTGVDLDDLDNEMLEEIKIDKKLHRTRVLKEIALLRSSAGVVCSVASDRLTARRRRPRQVARPAYTRQFL